MTDPLLGWALIGVALAGWLFLVVVIGAAITTQALGSDPYCKRCDARMPHRNGCCIVCGFRRSGSA